ncbi:MAG: uracil-DNA glycosylase family protein [Bacteroidia bacterium]
MDLLLDEISKCRLCEAFLPLGPRPVLSAHTDSKIVIIGQAPGSVVHKSGIPWDDKSGENLRSWMGISPNTFYDAKQIALIPMGFCYPGKGKTGDSPPRKECAPQWHQQLLHEMNQVKLILLIGAYAQNYYLHSDEHKTLTERVFNFKEYLPHYFVLPHPSPRNNIWQKKNEWFRSDVVPKLKSQVHQIISQ